MQLNSEDGGKRKFIMVQIPEPTDEKSEAYKAGYKNICEIGKERIRRAGKKIKEGVVDAPLESEEDSEEEDSERLDFSQVGGVSRARATVLRSSQQPTANSQFWYYEFRCQAKFSGGFGYWVSCTTSGFQQSFGCVLQTSTI